jgi:transposase
MRGRENNQNQLFFTIDIESRIRDDHPLRSLKKRVDAILDSMDESFSSAYSKFGRPSVPPERLLKALLLMTIYSIRSERQLAERIDTDLLFRWFLDMNPEEDAFDATVLTHNRPRMEQHGIISAFFDGVLREAIEGGLCSDDHFTVDGTMIESMASMKSFRPHDEADDNQDSNSFKPRNPDVDFKGQKRSNETHHSRTDPEAKLYRKGPGKPAQLSHLGHILTENRNGLIVEVAVTEANGTAECEAALAMVDQYETKHGKPPTTLGADKGYDNGPTLISLETKGVVPHIAMTKTQPANPETARADRKANIEARLRMKDRQATEGYSISQRVRKKVEECFGWLKTIAEMDRSRWAQRWKLKQQFELSAAAYNLLRLRKLKPV